MKVLSFVLSSLLLRIDAKNALHRRKNKVIDSEFFTSNNGPASSVENDGKSISDFVSESSKKVKAKKQGLINKVKKLIREGKSLLSSDMEMTVLKATRPNDNLAKRKHVKRMIGASLYFPTFLKIEGQVPRNREEGPYHMLLLKLWRQMKSSDWRTSTKSLYILHRLAIETSAESYTHFHRTFLELRASVQPPPFEPKQIKRSPQNNEKMKFIKKQAKFVFNRIEQISPDINSLFSEMCAMEKVSTETILAWMKNLQKAIEVGIECSGLLNDIGSEIEADSSLLIANDTVKLWELYEALMEKISSAEKTENNSEFELLKEFHGKNVKKVISLAKKGNKIAKFYGFERISIPKGSKGIERANAKGHKSKPKLCE
uniref:ENTH domain-containing protein n=1 Tax=Vaucheria litorea TaxID=109269 RepID=H6WB97_VAULI|nr:hypothetical protein [Vaucheria litorea]